jgi:hypothetical protein
MLYGTDLSSAYSFDFDPSPKQAPQPPKPVVQQKPEKEVFRNDPPPTPSLDPTFLTSDQKLHLLSNELQKQKEFFEQQKGNNYVDRLLSKKKDIVKLLLISFVILLAISLHYIVDHYIKQFFEENVMSSGKEFLIRLLYPSLVLLILWNMKAFSR